MKILVTGASGFVGRVLCKALHEQAYTLIAADYKTQSLNDQLERVVVGELDSHTDWSVALHEVDVVIHLAARVHVMKETVADPSSAFRKANVDGALHLASEAARVGVKRFIFMSSVKVNGESSLIGKPFVETCPTNPQDAYGSSKLEAEQGLFKIAQSTAMEVVVIRSPLVYGEGVKANFASLIRTVKSGLPLPFGAIHNKRSFVYVDNLVSLILCCINHPAAANQLFFVSDGSNLSTPELISKLANSLGIKPVLMPIPQKVIEFTANLIGKKNLVQRLCGNLEVDITKAKDLLNWDPPYTMEEGLKKTVSCLTQKRVVS